MHDIVRPVFPCSYHTSELEGLSNDAQHKVKHIIYIQSFCGFCLEHNVECDIFTFNAYLIDVRYY